MSNAYDPDYGDKWLCKCGHPYYRHFDPDEDMAPCRCKYCKCEGYVEIPSILRDIDRVRKNMPSVTSEEAWAQFYRARAASSRSKYGIYDPQDHQPSRIKPLTNTKR